MINRAHERCQNMDKEGVPSSSGIHIIDEETESDEYECINIIPVISDACGGQFLYQTDVQLCMLFLNVRPTVYNSFNVALVYVDVFVTMSTSDSCVNSEMFLCHHP